MNRDRNGMRNMREGGEALEGSLLDKIRALSFVKTELELYLDTHPRCKTALDYYKQTLKELARLTEEYENTVAPLTAAGVISLDEWTWTNGPWPWQRESDIKKDGAREGVK